METKKPRKITPEEAAEIRERFSGQMDEMVQNLNRRALEAAERDKNPRDAILEAKSDVPLAKRRAYLGTLYRLGFGADDIVMEIASHNARLATRLAELGVSCGGFITAYNAAGTQQSDEANSRDHATLLAHVTALGHAFTEGAGTAATGDWPAERSVFAYGMNKASACAMGRQFRQDAIVWVGPDAVPQLVLLR